MGQRTCEYCGSGINLLRAGARFCSAKHRVYAARKPVIPAEMIAERRWVRRNNRKMPLTLAGRNASSTNPDTWAEYAAARRSHVGVGMGFVLGEGIGCIDLDHCFEDGKLAGWAQEIVDACPETYMEVSPSGDGLHIFGLLAEGAGRKMRDGARNVEFYSVGRYITVTGARFGGSSRLADLSGVVASVL